MTDYIAIGPIYKISLAMAELNIKKKYDSYLTIPDMSSLQLLYTENYTWKINYVLQVELA